MKKLLLVALLCASSALAGLTATQINQVIAYCDTCGYSSVAHLDLSGFDDNGHPSITRLMIFYRATDDEYECLDPRLCTTITEAENQLVGSKYMWAIRGRLRNQRPAVSNQ